MQLIYVDDYGNTGKRLDDPQQPVFMLFALLVPERSWVVLEAAINDLLEEISDRADLEDDLFELHAAEFFSVHNKSLLTIGLDERALFARRVAQLVKVAGGTYVATYIDKPKFASALTRLSRDNLLHTIEQLYKINPYLRELGERVFLDSVDMSSISELLENALSPYHLAFSRLIYELDTALGNTSQTGLIIIDRQDQYAHATKLKSFAALRHPSVGGLKNVLELPVIGDSKINILLQVADVMGYLAGMSLSAQLGYKKVTERHRPTIAIIRESMVLTSALAEGVQQTMHLFLIELSNRAQGKQMTARSVSQMTRSGLIDFEKGEKTPSQGWNSYTSGLFSNFPQTKATTNNFGLMGFGALNSPEDAP